MSHGDYAPPGVCPPIRDLNPLNLVRLAMLSLNKILVPFDFSEFSREALVMGLNMARRTGAEVHVLHIEMLHANSLIETATEPLKAEALRARVEDEVNDYSALSDGAVVFFAVGRDIAPGPSIVEYARKHNIDLIMMGTHGRRGFRRFLLGSVTEEVMRHAECPVLTVPRRNEKSRASSRISRILVPTDFSVHSENALLYAKELALLFDAQLDLLHAVSIPAQVTFYDTGLFSIYEYQPELEVYAEDQLKVFYEDSSGPDLKRVTFTVAYEPEADSIRRFADENDSDLIVMGTHGRTGLERFMMGNVTARTIRHVNTPVFIVKSFGKSLLEEKTRYEEAELIG